MEKNCHGKSWKLKKINKVMETEKSRKKSWKSHGKVMKFVRVATLDSNIHEKNCRQLF